MMIQDIDNISSLLSSVDLSDVSNHSRAFNTVFAELVSSQKSLEEAHVIIAQVEEQSSRSIAKLEHELSNARSQIENMRTEIEMLYKRLDECTQENKELYMMYEEAQYKCDSFIN